MSERDNAKVIDALYRRAIGCSIETTEVVAEGKTKSRGKRTIRQIPPDTKACIYILNNRCSEDWGAKPQQLPPQIIARMRLVNRKKPPCKG